MRSDSRKGSFTQSVYLVNLIALIPRHWFVYLIFLLVPFMLYINIDGKPNGDDSGHYFNLWLLGTIYTAFGVGFIVADLLNKPLLYCMPRQQSVLRRIVFAFGVFFSLLFFLLAVLPQYSYWAQPTAVGQLTPIPIGLMLYLMVVYSSLRSIKNTSWALAVAALSGVLILNVYFRGSGADIVRPPQIIFTMLALLALVLIPVFWKLLGHASLRRHLLGTETVSSDGDDIVTQLEKFNMYQRGKGDRGADFSTTKTGKKLLGKIRNAGGWQQSFLNLRYRSRSANSQFRMIMVWLVFGWFATTLSFKTFETFTPILLLYLCMLLVTFQGAFIFRRTNSPWLPYGRRALFREYMTNALLRYGLLIVLFALIFGVTRAGYKLWPQETWSVHLKVLLELQPGAYLYCFFMAPLMLFFFHCSRTPRWFLLVAFISWATAFSSHKVSQIFAGFHGLVVILLLIMAWLPFITLIYLRSFKRDLK